MTTHEWVIYDSEFEPILRGEKRFIVKPGNIHYVDGAGLELTTTCADSPRSIGCDVTHHQSIDGHLVLSIGNVRETTGKGEPNKEPVSKLIKAADDVVDAWNERPIDEIADAMGELEVMLAVIGED